MKRREKVMFLLDGSALGVGFRKLKSLLSRPLLLLFIIPLFNGCLSEVPGGAGSDAYIPYQGRLTFKEAKTALLTIGGVSIFHVNGQSQLNDESMYWPTGPFKTFVISYRTQDSGGGGIVFNGAQIGIHATVPLRGRHLPEREFGLIRQIYERLRAVHSDLTNPRTVTVVRDYGLSRSRNLEP